MCLMWQDDLGPCHVSGGEGMQAENLEQYDQFYFSLVLPKRLN